MHSCFIIFQSTRNSNMKDRFITVFLPPATKLGQGYVFIGVCHSVNRGGVPDQVPPRTRYTPPDQVHPPGTRYTPLGPGTPLGTRYSPRDQVHPPGPGTPPRTRYTPLGPGTPPGTRYTPRDQVHPPWTRKIRSTRGRYASYWNAFLLFFSFSSSAFPY